MVVHHPDEVRTRHSAHVGDRTTPTVVSASPDLSVRHVAEARSSCEPAPNMADVVGPERIGSVLRAMAEDLVSERRRVLLLRRENRRLTTALEAAGVTFDSSVASLPEGYSENGGRRRRVCPYCGRSIHTAQP